MAKKYTKRITPLNNQALAELRQSALKKARTADEVRFVQSARFKTELNKQIRLNRGKSTVKKIESIKGLLADDKDAQRGAQKLLGSRASVRKDGTITKRYSETSEAQRKRLNKISRQLKTGKLTPTMIKRLAQNDPNYKENKRFLPPNAGIKDVLLSLVRDAFYYENLDLVEKYNEKVGRRGKPVADASQQGQRLRLEYQNYLKSKDKSLIDFIVKNVK